MKYFEYQQNGTMGRVWSLFRGLNDISEEEKLGKVPFPCAYAHTLEIVSAALSGALALDDFSLGEFNLKAYEFKCEENDNIGKIKQTDKLLYIVDNLSEEDTSVGFGDVSERKLKTIDDSFDLLESLSAFESNLAVLCNIRKKYITEKGIDLVHILVSSLKGIPESVSELTSLVKENKTLQELITSLCEDSMDGLLIERLEMVL